MRTQLPPRIRRHKVQMALTLAKVWMYQEHPHRAQSGKGGRQIGTFSLVALRAGGVWLPKLEETEA